MADDDLLDRIASLSLDYKIEEDRQIRPIVILKKDAKGDFLSLPLTLEDFCRYFHALEKRLQNQFQIDKFAIETNVGSWARSKDFVVKGHIPINQFMEHSVNVRKSDKDHQLMEQTMQPISAFHDMSGMMDKIENWEKLSNGYRTPQLVDENGIREDFRALVITEASASLEECYPKLVKLCKDLDNTVRQYDLTCCHRLYSIMATTDTKSGDWS
eukprot:TRINITY_DN21615_c0_g1_i2.p1 TRINITY_DN21615_c0_g1~~TRINITY_DN21615_c0_g1_i2.p1  ORF type:complete len:226 (+),score=50.17 TRINITY_DN21615_c0_g1_i2:37-678(+)